MLMDDLQNGISRWAERTFTHTDKGIANHLLREAVELCQAAGLTKREIDLAVSLAARRDNYEPKLVEEEAADVTILALTLAGHRGFSLEKAVTAKHIVNQQRVWATPDEQGITEHARGGATDARS